MSLNEVALKTPEQLAKAQRLIQYHLAAKLRQIYLSKVMEEKYGLRR